MRRRFAPPADASVWVGSESDFSDRSVGRHPWLTGPCLGDAPRASQVRRPSVESAACQTRLARRQRRRDPFVLALHARRPRPRLDRRRILNGRGPTPTPMRRSARLELRVRRCARPVRPAPVVLGLPPSTIAAMHGSTAAASRRECAELRAGRSMRLLAPDRLGRLPRSASVRGSPWSHDSGRRRLPVVPGVRTACTASPLA